MVNNINDKKVYKISEDELEEYYKNLTINSKNNNSGIENNNSIHVFENKRHYINNNEKLNKHIKYLIKEINKKFYSFYLAGRYEYDAVLLNKMQYISQPFENGDFDIFISYSHKDIKVINQLSENILKKFHKNSFIDSKYWKYKDDLIIKTQGNYVILNIITIKMLIH